MARLNIDTGTLGNPATGDTLRTAMTKINTNFEEVFQLVGDGDTGLLTTDVTNGDLKIQANGTGIIEIDQLQINNTAISPIVTNSDLTLKVIMANLPSSNPSVAGQLFRDGTDLKVSTG
jgi:hypothetical protein